MQIANVGPILLCPQIYGHIYLSMLDQIIVYPSPRALSRPDAFSASGSLTHRQVCTLSYQGCLPEDLRQRQHCFGGVSLQSTWMNMCIGTEDHANAACHNKRQIRSVKCIEVA